MADRFKFSFESVNGKAVSIIIADSSYSGSVVSRCVGGHPQLRFEKADSICGTSLEIPAECVVEDEFAILYTSDPTRFAVRLVVGGSTVWRGFVSPELYAAPWIDPPYDVNVTATDGLGELKTHTYAAQGRSTLSSILDMLLGATGLTLSVRMVSTAANDLTTTSTLLNTTINLDHMAGESYYDVLDGILSSLHATIRQRDGGWLIIRETDITALTSGGRLSDLSGNKYAVKAFGSAQSNDCWPVGRLTSEVVPAKSVVKVECPNEPEALIPDPDMSLNLWNTTGEWSEDDGCFYTLESGEYMRHEIDIVAATRRADPGFRITISARQTGTEESTNMSVAIMAIGRDPRGSSDITLSFTKSFDHGHEYVSWESGESFVEYEIDPGSKLNYEDCKDITVDDFTLPSALLNPLKKLVILIRNDESASICIHAVKIALLRAYDKAVTTLSMDNNARGNDSFSSVFADSFAGNKGLFVFGNACKVSSPVSTWSSDSIPSCAYGEWLAKDYALSCATPRLRLKGTLNTTDKIPAVLYATQGVTFYAEEWSFDLIEDEAEISLISLPAAALQVDTVDVVVADNDGRTSSTSGGDIVSPKSGSSASGYGAFPDWFIAESFQENDETKYRLRLNDKYLGMYANGYVSAGGLSNSSPDSATALSELTDVYLSAPSDGQALVWDASLNSGLGGWRNGTVSGGGGIGTTSLYALDEVLSSTSPAEGDLFYFNGSKWTNIPSSSLSLSLYDLTIQVQGTTRGTYSPATAASTINITRTQLGLGGAATRNVASSITSSTTGLVPGSLLYSTLQGYAKTSDLPDWFVEYTDGSGNVSLRLNTRYNGIWTDGFVSAGGYSGTGGGGGGASLLSELTDVSLNSPASGNVLYYNGSAWTNRALTSLLSGYATVSQLGNYATISSLNNYATLSQLDNYATISQLGNYQPVDADLTAIAALTGSGYLRKTGSGWALAGAYIGTTAVQASSAVQSLTGIGNITPGANGTYKLGSSSSRWDELHVNKIYVGAGAPYLYWDATNNTWRVTGNFVADGFVSAGGVS